MSEFKKDANKLFASAKNKKEQLKQQYKTVESTPNSFDESIEKRNQFEKEFFSDKPEAEVTATTDEKIKENTSINKEAFGDVVTNVEPNKAELKPEEQKNEQIKAAGKLPSDYFVEAITVANKNELDNLNTQIANWKSELEDTKKGKKKKKGEVKEEYEELKLAIDKAKEFKEQNEQIDDLEETIKDLEARRKELLEKIRLEAEQLKKTKDKNIEVLRKEYKDNPNASYFGDTQIQKDKRTKKALALLFAGLSALAAIIITIVAIVTAPPKVPEALRLSSAQTLEIFMDGENEYYYSRGPVTLFASVVGKSDSKEIIISNRTPNIVEINKSKVAHNEHFIVTPKLDDNGNPLGGVAEIFVRQEVGGQERHDSIKILMDTPVIDFNFAYINAENHLVAATGDNLVQDKVLNVIGKDYNQTGAYQYDFYMGQYANINTIAQFGPNRLEGGIFSKTALYEVLSQEIDITYNPLGKDSLRVNVDELAEGDVGFGQDVLTLSEDGRYLLANYPGKAVIKAKTLKYMGGVEEWVETEQDIEIVVKVPKIKNIVAKENDVYLGYNNLFKISDIITLIEGDYSITKYGDEVLASDRSKWTASDTQEYNDRKNLNSLLRTLHGEDWWNFDKSSNSAGNDYGITYIIDDVDEIDENDAITTHTETYLMFNNFIKEGSGLGENGNDWSLNDNPPNFNIYLGETSPGDRLPTQLATLVRLELMYNLDVKVEVMTTNMIIYGNYREYSEEAQDYINTFDLRYSLDLDTLHPETNQPYQPFMRLVNNNPNLVRTDGKEDPYGFSMEDVYFKMKSAQNALNLAEDTFTPQTNGTYEIYAYLKNGLGFSIKYRITNANGSTQMITINNNSAINIDPSKTGLEITSMSSNWLTIIVG